ncbi:MAG: indole-3-glycerol phosphate synthase TrpC [Bacteroidota bacterium]
MNYLDEIIAHKRKEVAEAKSLVAVQELEKSHYFNRETISLKAALLKKNSTGIIAEFKRKSPSKGIINQSAEVKQTTTGYINAGASALSVLTDTNYFGGSKKDLTEARQFNSCPILRKDFTIDEYQIIEAKSIGADVILLIAAVLSKEEIKSLTAVAVSLGLEVLLEIHEAEELDKADVSQHLIGINNRNLKTFEVNLKHSIALAEKLPADVVKIAESGISKPENILLLKQHGFNGFLIGENFMKEAQPEIACKKFIESLSVSV